MPQFLGDTSNIYLEAKGGKDKAPAGADDVHHDQEHGVFAGAAVGAEQYQVTHAGRNERAGEHRCQLQRAFQIQLRNDHARRAVGNEADKRRTQDSERLVAAQELLDRGLAKGLEHGDQNQRHQKNEYRNLHGVRNSAADNRQDGRAFV